MAPEQARGEIDQVDERADVFALGSILCEILTGQPAFIGRSSGEIQRKAALGDLADAVGRLDACGADAELVALAKDCLAREAEDRPRAAGAVAERVTAYLAGVQERLRRAELEQRGGAGPPPADDGRGRGGDPARPDRRRRLRLDPAAEGRADGEDGPRRRRRPGRRGAAARRGAGRPAGETARWAEALSAAKRAEGLLAARRGRRPAPGPGGRPAGRARPRARRRRREGPPRSRSTAPCCRASKRSAATAPSTPT